MQAVSKSSPSSFICWWKQYKVNMEMTEESHFTFKSHFITKSGSDTCGVFSEVFDWSASHILYDLIISFKWVLWTVADRDLYLALLSWGNFHVLVRGPTVNMSSFFLKLSTTLSERIALLNWCFCPHASEDGKYNSKLYNKAIFKCISLSYMTCYAKEITILMGYLLRFH